MYSACFQPFGKIRDLWLAYFIVKCPYLPGRSIIESRIDDSQINFERRFCVTVPIHYLLPSGSFKLGVNPVRLLLSSQCGDSP